MAKTPKITPTPEIEHARAELREAIESSRKIVRQTRILIELSESEAPVTAPEDKAD